MIQDFLNKRIKSFSYAFKGIWIAITTQTNVKIHVFTIFPVFGLGFFLDISLYEWMALMICIGMVISAEIMNTSIEFLTDLVSPEYLPQAGKVKDLAAAAVLLAAITAFLVGCIIFIPKLWVLINTQ